MPVTLPPMATLRAGWRSYTAPGFQRRQPQSGFLPGAGSDPGGHESALRTLGTNRGATTVAAAAPATTLTDAISDIGAQKAMRGRWSRDRWLPEFWPQVQQTATGQAARVRPLAAHASGSD